MTGRIRFPAVAQADGHSSGHRNSHHVYLKRSKARAERRRTRHLLRNIADGSLEPDDMPVHTYGRYVEYET